MAIRTVLTRGYGNGTFDGSIALVVTRGYLAAVAAEAPVVTLPPDFIGIGDMFRVSVSAPLPRPAPRRKPQVHETSVRFTAKTGGAASAVIIRKVFPVGGVASARLTVTVRPRIVGVTRPPGTARFQVSPIVLRDPVLVVGRAQFRARFTGRVYAEMDYEGEDLMLLGLESYDLLAHH